MPSTVITSREFHPAAVYRINVDNDGDAQADVAFTFTGSQPTTWPTTRVYPPEEARQAAHAQHPR